MKQAAQSLQNKSRLSSVKIGLAMATLAVAGYVLATHWQTVRASMRAALQADPVWLSAALVGMAATFCIAAGVYMVLAVHPLRYFQTVLVELATALVNRLLPWGLAGVGLHGVYLYKRGHTPAEATVVASVNNFLGIVANVLLLGVLLLVYPTVLSGFLHWPDMLDWRVGLLAILLVLGIMAVPPARQRVGRFAVNMWRSVRTLRPVRVLAGLGLALLLTATYNAILFAAARALGLDLNLVQTYVIFSFGMLASTATPTPGGLVGAEAGLFAGFMAYDVPASQAGAAVLLYRLVTYWLPLLPGAYAFYVVRQRKLL